MIRRGAGITLNGIVSGMEELFLDLSQVRATFFLLGLILPGENRRFYLASLWIFQGLALDDPRPVLGVLVGAFL